MVSKWLLLLFLAQVRYSVDTANCGAVNPSTGQYTAPAAPPSAIDCPVRATSTADSTVFDTATVSVAASPAPPPPSPPPAAGVTWLDRERWRDCEGSLGAGFPPGARSSCKVLGEFPLGTFPVPAVGGAYTDSNFGTTISVIGHGVVHGYSNPSAFSATGKYVFVAVPGEGVRVIDRATAALVTMGAGSITQETIKPHPTDDDLYYWAEGPLIRRFRISTRVTDTVFDAMRVFPPVVRSMTITPRALSLKPSESATFTTTVVRDPIPILRTGSASNISVDGLFGAWIEEAQQVCVINVFTGRSYCGSYREHGVTNHQGVAPSHGADPDGSRYVYFQTTPSAVFYTVNEAAQRLDFSFRGPDASPDGSDPSRSDGDGVCETGETYCFQAYHGDMGHDAGGRQFWLSGADIREPGGHELVAFPFASKTKLWAERKRIARLWAAGGMDQWPGYHMGCAANAPVCVVSLHNFLPYRSSNDLVTPWPRGNYQSEVWALRFNADGSVEIRRLAMHRSAHWDFDQYWSFARATVSPGGDWALWGTNLGHPIPTGHVVAAATGF